MQKLNSFYQKINIFISNELFVKYWKNPLIASAISIVSYFLLPASIKAMGAYNQISIILIIAILTWLAVQATRTFRDIVINNAFKRQQHLDAQRINTQAGILTKITIMVLITVGVSLILITFPQIREIGVSILASAGVAGVMLGFAAQKSLVNILAGVHIALTQPIKIGDEVMVENENGTIEEINLTYVVICTIDQRRLIIPINYFIDKPFQNWTRNSSDLVGIIYIEVDYTAPIQKIREALDSILQTTNLWDKKIHSLQVTNAKEHSIELRAMASAANPTDTANLRCYIREKLIEFLQINHPYCLPKIRLDFEANNETKIKSLS